MIKKKKIKRILSKFDFENKDRYLILYIYRQWYDWIGKALVSDRADRLSSWIESSRIHR